MRRTYIDRVFEYYQQKDEEVGHWDEDVVGSMSEYPWPQRVDSLGEPQMFTRRILVVDDEANIRNMYYRIFTRRGFQVLTASNAMEAKDMLVREHIDIVFLDIKMAEVEGDILFELVRAFHQNVKIVVSSVYPLEEQMERIKGADAYFDKSDSQDVLFRTVSSLIRNSL
ncbi:MAG: response regulator [Candidatus Omnitrophica bacterium]|nr:response regulator [Candidatus Omnitrophota bacterium]